MERILGKITQMVFVSLFVIFVIKFLFPALSLVIALLAAICGGFIHAFSAL